MNLKRLAPVLSVGIGAVALILLLGSLSRPDAVVSARLDLSQSGAAGETAYPLTNAASVHYVTITGTDSGDCSTPAGACRTVQYAVDAAGDGDLIRIATGVYTDVHSRDTVTQVVYISKSLSLYGGYAPDFDAGPDPIARPTILDAQGRGRVVFIQGDITVTLAGLHIRGGDATGDDGWLNRRIGGGVYAAGATVTISASHVYSNTASRYTVGSGGGLAFAECTVTLVNNHIRRNMGFSGLVVDFPYYGIGTGGGLIVGGGEFNIVGNQILSNTALIAEQSHAYAYGGGVAILSSSGQFVNNLIDGNVAARIADGNVAARVADGNVAASLPFGFGGGVYFEEFRDRYGWVTIRGNVVQNNVAYAGDRDIGNGGGIHIVTTAPGAIADVHMSDNVLQGNVAAVTGRGVGGGLWAVASSNSTMTLAFRNNLVLSNTATLSGFDDGVGGGVVIGAVHADFEHNRFIGNRAGSGSAIYFSGSHVEQQADILRGNVTRGFSEGWLLEDPGSAVVFEGGDATVSNLVVIDNRATSTGTAILVRSSDVRLVHPTLARNTGGGGVHVEESTRSRVALTNAVLVSHTVGITVGAGNTATLDAVLWYSNTTNVGGAGHITVTRAYTGHPTFDADGYHLTAASAAIDAGIFVGVGTDIDGDTRPDGCFPDLGADEFITGVDCGRIYLPIVVRQSP
jgi:hypothetical protein